MNDATTGAWRWGRRRLAAVLVIGAATAGAVVWAAAPATAVAAPVLVETSSATNSNSFKNAIARCPAGTKVYGAAFNVVNGLGAVVVNTLQPSTDLSQVLVEANEVGSGITSDWRVIAQAICGTPVANLHLETSPASAVTSTTTSKTTRVNCPAGQKVYGAGYSFFNGYGEVFLTLMAHDSSLGGVTVQGVIDDNPSLAWNVTAYATCGTPAATQVMVVGPNFTIDSNSPKSTSASCPSGTHVHGIGVISSGASGDLLAEDGVVTPALTSAQAKSYENDPSALTWFVTPEVVCAS